MALYRIHTKDGMSLSGWVKFANSEVETIKQWDIQGDRAKLNYLKDWQNILSIYQQLEPRCVFDRMWSKPSIYNGAKIGTEYSYSYLIPCRYLDFIQLQSDSDLCSLIEVHEINPEE